MRGRRGGAAAAMMLGAVLGFLFVAGYFSRDPLTEFAARGPRTGVTALYYSGDAGLRFGMGPATAAALSAHGMPVIGVNAATLFRRHRSRAEVNAIVAMTVRQGLARAGSDRLVLIGQSFGADILQTGLAALPEALRRRIAGVILVVPGAGVFFRADPTGLLYRTRPDSPAGATLRMLTWAPLTCIYGKSETDSACPGLRMPNAVVVAMPGGHFLARDSAGLIRHVLAAIAKAACAQGTRWRRVP